MLATVFVVLLYVTFACAAVINSEDKCSGYQLECPEDDTCISLNSKCLSVNREPGEECTIWTSEVRWVRCPEGKCDSSVGDLCHDITTCDTVQPKLVNINDTTFESCYSPDPIPNLIMTPSLPSGKHYDYLFFEYKCPPEYVMVGDKYQFCSNGKWCGKTPKCVRISSGTTEKSPLSWLTSSILIGPTTSFRSFSPSMSAIRIAPVRPPTVYTPPASRPILPPSFKPPPPPVIQRVQPRIATGGPQPFGAGKPPPFVSGRPVPSGSGKPPQFHPRGPTSAGAAPRPVPGKPLNKNLSGPRIRPKVKVSQEQSPKEDTNTGRKISKIDRTEVQNIRNSGNTGNSETVPKVVAKVEEVNTKQKPSEMESPNQKSSNSGTLSSNQKFSNPEEESTNQKPSTLNSESTNQKQPEGISRVIDKILATNGKEKPATSGAESTDKMSDGSKTSKAELPKQKWAETLLKAIGKMGKFDAKQKQTSAKSEKSDKSDKSSDSDSDTDKEKKQSESESSKKSTSILSSASSGGSSMSISSVSTIGQPLSAGKSPSTTQPPRLSWVAASTFEGPINSSFNPLLQTNTSMRLTLEPAARQIQAAIDNTLLIGQHKYDPNKPYHRSIRTTFGSPFDPEIPPSYGPPISLSFGINNPLPINDINGPAITWGLNNHHNNYIGRRYGYPMRMHHQLLTPVSNMPNNGDNVPLPFNSAMQRPPLHPVQNPFLSNNFNGGHTPFPNNGHLIPPPYGPMGHMPINREIPSFLASRRHFMLGNGRNLPSPLNAVRHMSNNGDIMPLQLDYERHMSRMYPPLNPNLDMPINDRVSSIFDSMEPIPNYGHKMQLPYGPEMDGPNSPEMDSPDSPETDDSVPPAFGPDRRIPIDDGIFPLHNRFGPNRYPPHNNLISPPFDPERSEPNIDNINLKDQMPPNGEDIGPERHMPEHIFTSNSNSTQEFLNDGTVLSSRKSSSFYANTFSSSQKSPNPYPGQTLDTAHKRILLPPGEYSDAAHIRIDSNSLRLSKVSPPGIETQPTLPRSIRKRRRSGSGVNRSRTRPRTSAVSHTRAGTRTRIEPRKRARPDLHANTRNLPTGTRRFPPRKPLANDDSIPPPDRTLSNSDSSKPSKKDNRLLPRITHEVGDIPPPPRKTSSKEDSLPPSRKILENSDKIQPPPNTDEVGDIPPPPRKTLSKDDSLPSSRKILANRDKIQPPPNTDEVGDIPPPPRKTSSKDDSLPPSRKILANSDNIQPPPNTDEVGDIPPPPRKTSSKDDSLPPSRKILANSDNIQPPPNTDEVGDIPPPPRKTSSKDDSLPPSRKILANSDNIQPPPNTDEVGDIPPPPRKTSSKDDSLPPSRKILANSDNIQPPPNTDEVGDIPPPPRKTSSKDDSLPPSRKILANSDNIQPPPNTDEVGDIPPPPRKTLSKDDSLPSSRKTSTNSDSLQPSRKTDEEGDILPPPRKSLSKDDNLPPSRKTSANSDSLQPSLKTDPKQSSSTISADKESHLASSKQIPSIKFDDAHTQSISKRPQLNEPQQREIQQSQPQKGTSKESPSKEVTITLQKVFATDSSKAQKQDHSEIDSNKVAKQSVLGSAFSLIQKLPELIPKVLEALKESDNIQKKTAISDSANQQLLMSVIDSANQKSITSSVDSANNYPPTSAMGNTNSNPSSPGNDLNPKKLTTGSESKHQNPSILKIDSNLNPSNSDVTQQKQPTSDAKSANQKHETQSNQKAAGSETKSTNERLKIKGESDQDLRSSKSDASKKQSKKQEKTNSNTESLKSSSTNIGQPLSGGDAGGGSSIGGADSAPVEYICRANEWTCNDGSCVNETNRCDGYIDCPDSSDEWECSINASCTLPPYPDHGIYTRRVDVNTTVPASPREEYDTVLLHINCDDGYDATIKDIICINGTWMNEMPKCENLDVIKRLPNNSANWCTSTQWRCNDGGCIDNKEKCDGKNDCYDRSDELYCTVKDKNSYSNCVVPDHPPNGMYTFSPPYEPGREVVFVNVSVECDEGFRADKESVRCTDGEWNGKNPECIQLVSTANCSEGQWQCINGECISMTSKCDGHYDCIDHTDEAEELCSKNNANLNQTPCSVPFINNGQYTISDYTKIQPGGGLAPKFLNVTCDDGHMLQGMPLTLCSKGIWMTPIPKCTRYCLLKQHPSMQYQCRVMENGITGFRPCREKEPIGTVVKLSCSTHFYSEEFLPDIKCTEFGWSHSQTCKAECGTLTPHVKKLSIGGQVANRSDVPWHAGIYQKKRDKTNNITKYEQICGGTLISYSIVLSAAHCFHADNNNVARISRRQFAVGIGKIYRLWDDPLEIAEDVQKSDVKRIIIPESYHSDSTYYQSDIALIEVTKPFEHRAHIVPVCLDLDAEFDERHINSGGFGKVAGWGYMNEYGESSPVLKILDEPIFNHSYCFQKVPTQSRPLITSDKICAGYTDGTQALCGGDSGGGLSMPEVRRGIERYYLRGIVSTSTPSTSGGKQCNKYSLTYFTRVVHHMGLISQWWSPI